MYEISAIISTYNRCDLLDRAIKSVINQTIDKSLYEIIIVDNNSTDKTKETVEKYLTERNIRYIFEPKQGLSHARNAGFKNANADYVAYMDDDAKADELWLENIVKTIEEIKPDILGGPIYPFYLSEKPKWFRDKYEIRSNGDKAKYLMVGEYLSGSNVIYKKKLLELLGGFNPKLGMVGNKLSYGEETKLIIEARKKIETVKIYYTPEIVVYHLVPLEKMNLKYFIKSNFKSGMSGSHIFESETTKTKFEGFKLLFNLLERTLYIFLMMCRLLFRDRNKYKYANNYLVEVICPHFNTLGSIYEKVIDFIKRIND